MGMSENNKVSICQIKGKVTAVVDDIEESSANRYSEKFWEVSGPFPVVAVPSDKIDRNAEGIQFFVAAFGIDIPSVNEIIAFCKVRKPVLTKYTVGIRYNSNSHSRLHSQKNYEIIIRTICRFVHGKSLKMGKIRCILPQKRTL